MKKQYSPEFKAAIAALHWEDGKTYAEIAEENKISMNAIQRWAKQYSPAVNEQGEKITNQYVDDLKAKNAELERDNRILR